MFYLGLGLLLGYILGSIPTGYIFGRILRGVDIREHGSGNVGATNVFRVVGKSPGVVVLLLDIFKGFLVVGIISNLFKEQAVSVMGNFDLFRILMGITVVAGHNWTCFLKFKGGKGVATSTGVFLALAPEVIGVCFFVWVSVLMIKRYVSLASIISALSFPILSFFMDVSRTIFIFSIFAAIMIVLTHRSNIKRLIAGTEKRVWVKK